VPAEAIVDFMEIVEVSKGTITIDKMEDRCNEKSIYSINHVVGSGGFYSVKRTGERIENR
jgi:hypothetical protein